MKKIYKSVFAGFSVVLTSAMVSCSNKDDDAPIMPEPEPNYVTTVIGFKNVAPNLIASDQYGANLYYGAQDQITQGCIIAVSDDVFAQFPINYGATYDNTDPYGYTFFAGGMAVSKYHDMINGTYLNQLSVYSPISPSGGNFVVSFGNANDASYQQIPNWQQNTLADYDECGHVYLTDAKGYSAPNPGTATTQVTGVAKSGFFKSVAVNNTTYAYLVMKNGNGFTDNSDLQSQNGWFKVQFIAFADNKPTSKPVGCVEAYLANFDSSLAATAGFSGKIVDDWTNVDLSSLPEASILVVNLVGSDAGAYGLNTPNYCALDNFEISVKSTAETK